METRNIPKLPIQLEKPLRDYKIAYAKYQELRAKPGADVRRLDEAWKKNQKLVFQIEDSLIRQYGQEAAEEMLEQAIGWKTLRTE
jgi:hypothetical protein